LVVKEFAGATAVRRFDSKGKLPTGRTLPGLYAPEKKNAHACQRAVKSTETGISYVQNYVGGWSRENVLFMLELGIGRAAPTLGRTTVRVSELHSHALARLNSGRLDAYRA